MKPNTERDAVSGQLFAWDAPRETVDFFACADRPRIKMQNGAWTLEGRGCGDVAKLRAGLAFVQRKNRERNRP